MSTMPSYLVIKDSESDEAKEKLATGSDRGAHSVVRVLNGCNCILQVLAQFLNRRGCHEKKFKFHLTTVTFGMASEFIVGVLQTFVNANHFDQSVNCR